MTRVHRQMKRKALVKPIAKPSKAKAHTIKTVPHPSRMDTEAKQPVFIQKASAVEKPEAPLYVKIPLALFMSYQVFSYMDRRNYSLLPKIGASFAASTATEMGVDYYYE